MKNRVNRTVMLAALLLASLVSSLPLYAASTVAVGTCHKAVPSYTTVQDAVNAVGSGGTVQVCPGMYPEQIIINHPLTLKGIPNGTSQAAVIVAPNTGMVENFSSGNIGPSAAHVLVQNTTGVTISNITVEGSNCPAPLSEVGIASLASDTTVTNSVVRKIAAAVDTCFGASIYAEAAGNLAVQSSSIHSFYYGVLDIDGTNTNISSNLITDGLYAISIEGTTGPATISSNTMEAIGCSVGCTGDNGIGISLSTPASGNSILNNIVGMTPSGYYGLALNTTATVTGNKLSGGVTAIAMFAMTASTIQSNTMINSTVGVEIDDTGTGGNKVTKNTIKETGCAIWNLSSTGDTVSPNTLTNNLHTACP